MEPVAPEEFITFQTRINRSYKTYMDQLVELVYSDAFMFIHDKLTSNTNTICNTPLKIHFNYAKNQWLLNSLLNAISKVNNLPITDEKNVAQLVCIIKSSVDKALKAYMVHGYDVSDLEIEPTTDTNYVSYKMTMHISCLDTPTL